MATDHDEDMYLFNGDMGQTPNAYAGTNFDSFLDSANAGVEDISTEYTNTDDFPVKKEYDTGLRSDNGYTRGSTSSSSRSSSSGSPEHNLDMSTATTTSPTTSKNDVWETGIDGYTIPMNEQYFDSGNMTGVDQDLDQQMASAFDFETAASTPSGFDAAAMNTGRVYAPNAQIRRKANVVGMNNNNKQASPRVTAAPASFFLGSREASPLNSMLPTSQAPSPWTKHSPSSGLEETFNHMGMNGDSPGNATFSPNMHMSYSDAQFSFPSGSTGTPSSIAKDFSSPASNMSSIVGRPTLTIQPTSLKSRVETQIPIRMALYPLPSGIRKIRLPTHTVSKPKFLAKPDVEKSPDTLELSVSLVCTSAMQDPHRKDRALRRARGEDVPAINRPSPASSSGSASSKDDEEKPLNGGEVKICSGCIQRERKRASRKKQKKPEEEELFQKDEERRVVVFNTNEIKEWQDMSQDTPLPSDHSPMPAPGTYQVELPMRIACYCRHQNEKMGFMVIFTIKDFRGNVIAQAMTNSIMITDDHKTHNAPQPLPSAPLTQQTHFPGAGVFPTGGDGSNEGSGPKLFKSSYSTPDLTRLQQSPNGQYPGPSGMPFAIPQVISGNTSATLTPRNLSRPASPSGPSGPATKRRKPSGSGKLPSGLTMTRLDTVQAPPGPATMPNTAASSPFMPSMPTFMAGPDPRNLQSSMHPRTFNSPPTPGGDGTFNSVINRSFSLENLPRQAALMSAPSSRQPSRPGSPLADPRNSFGQQDATFPHAVNQSLLGQSSRRPAPVIHKVVPNEGSVSGGTEVTLLGNGFYQGLEVMFGDTEATTTTFWGEKCLNCIAPPGVGPGMVHVLFKHEHPHYAGSQASSHVKQSIYTYVDDREIEMLRLALRTIGKQMGTDDPYAEAKQYLQQNQSAANGMFGQQGAYGGMANGHSRNTSGPGGHQFAPYEMELCLLNMLRLAKKQMGSSVIDLDLRRPTGLSLLHYAASLGMPQFVSDLLSAGADPNVLDNNGFTPMHHAALNGHEIVINNLRSGGADHRLRSIRNWTPTDLATTLQTWRATMQSYEQSRAQSTGNSTLEPSSRNISSKSLNAFWDNTSIPPTESESEYTEEERDTVIVPSIGHPLPFAQPLPHSQQTSRRGSRQGLPSQQAAVRTVQLDAPPASPSTLMNAWRQLVNMTQTQQNQLVEQIQQFQDSMPALPHLPQLDYQNNGVVRRMSSLLPHRFSPPIAAKDKEESASTIAPPSYDELYPRPLEVPSGVDKKEIVTSVQAAAEAALDQHFERQETLSKSISIARTGPLQTPDKASRVGIRDDARLFLFWIPILIVFVSLIAFSSPLPQMISWGRDRFQTLVPLEA